MVRIKVCGMCNPLNVKEISKTNPDFMGFIFYPGSPRYIGANPDKSIFHNVPPGIKRIGVFVNEDNEKILDLSINYVLDMVQLHGNESPLSCFQLKSSGLIIIKTFNIDDDFNFEILKPYMVGCDYFLFDTKTKKTGGSGKKFNWDKLAEYGLDKPFFLSGGIGPEDTDLIKSIESREFFAVDINSRFESSPGIKNVSLVKTFIDNIKNNQI